ncbi:restriction endonuclease subunit S [Acinetobacter baumannii]|uniref:restriction endonuclease subunit S n=1 Tax=Acinetobacter baumannii TaxID=470 RepID=UPI0018DC68AB|nr:restriction endonuclease subunit S [Acinetobacter baumannii]MBH8250447.1 restriction endonuclease subunit S [Acinetobacter baumannii]
MAKYQAYAEYKDSGVGFLGEIPEHWIVSKVKYLAPFQVGWTPPTKNDSNFIGDNLWVNISDLKGKVINNTVKQISDKAALEASMDITPKGSLMYSFKLSVGAVSFAGCDMYTNEAIASFLHSAKLPLSYLYYALPKFVIENASTNIYGANILNQELIRNALLVEIPYIEAEKIANFLDHETAKIDHLIEKQQQLIELLKEKRQAVISHAVTKGLDPNVPMKDSGVEWLGEVPEHWEVSKFGYISQVVRGGSPRPAGDPTLFNGDYSPWVTVAEITKDDELYLTSTETFLTKKGSEQCRVFKAGTLLLSNSGATLGVPKILCIDANANDGVVGFEQLQIDIEFAYYYLSILTNDLRERVKQGSGQPNLNTDIVKNISIAIPPLSEIQLIVTEIKGQVEKFVSLIQKAERQILLMQERRTALISAAVTGKIDVRHWQALMVAGAQTELSA